MRARCAGRIAWRRSSGLRDVATTPRVRGWSTTRVYEWVPAASGAELPHRGKGVPSPARVRGAFALVWATLVGLGAIYGTKPTSVHVHRPRGTEDDRPRWRRPRAASPR